MCLYSVAVFNQPQNKFLAMRGSSVENACSIQSLIQPNFQLYLFKLGTKPLSEPVQVYF